MSEKSFVCPENFFMTGKNFHVRKKFCDLPPPPVRQQFLEEKYLLGAEMLSANEILPPYSLSSKLRPWLHAQLTILSCIACRVEIYFSIINNILIFIIP